MAIYVIWLLLTVAVMGAKYFSVKVITKLTKELAEGEMRLSKLRADIKLARTNLDVANRNLLQAQNMISSETGRIERLTEELTQLKAEEAKEMQESEEKLSKE